MERKLSGQINDTSHENFVIVNRNNNLSERPKFPTVSKKLNIANQQIQRQSMSYKELQMNEFQMNGS